MYTERLTAVRQKFDEWQIDALYITNPVHYRWLSGFTGSAGKLLITQTTAVLATDFRYWEQAARQSPHFSLFKLQRTAGETAALIAQAKATRIGFEASHLTVADYHDLPKNDAIKWVPLSETVEPFRRVKTTTELEKIQAAAAITDKAMAAFAKLAKPGMTELALAWELEKLMRELGATGLAFPIIVASGPNAALPHHRPGERPLQIGDAIVVDMGAELDGYKSDMTRTFHLGSEPADDFWRVYNITLEAQQAALAAMKPGMTGKQMDSLARDIIAANGHGEHFGHSLGHGVGLDIHEAPWLSQRQEKMVVGTGEVVTVEPGIYIPGWGGVRIEDLVVMEPDGIRFLSHCPKEPVITL
ncbi:MAG: aminopeptidase P family protein [Candidatus Promineifilaceae bacterium]